VSAFDSLPVLCSYCNRLARLVPSADVYGRTYGGPRWWCQDCDAHVGCHPGTETPLGTLANAALRAARQRAHSFFDPLWKDRPTEQERRRARTQLYAGLAAHLGLKVEDTHIGQFDAETCEKVVNFITTQYHL